MGNIQSILKLQKKNHQKTPQNYTKQKQKQIKKPPVECQSGHPNFTFKEKKIKAKQKKKQINPKHNHNKTQNKQQQQKNPTGKYEGNSLQVNFE